MRLIIFLYLSDEAPQTTNVSSYLYTLYQSCSPTYPQAYHPFSSVLFGCQTYLTGRLTDIYAVQCVGAALLVLWTFLVPQLLTFTVGVSEALVLL